MIKIIVVNEIFTGVVFGQFCHKEKSMPTMLL